MRQLCSETWSRMQALIELVWFSDAIFSRPPLVRFCAFCRCARTVTDRFRIRFSSGAERQRILAERSVHCIVGRSVWLGEFWALQIDSSIDDIVLFVDVVLSRETWRADATKMCKFRICPRIG